ncbi:hypothetical protein NARC_100145 [Candidatus Nitrosocosmicus arcticus]|uniref:Uncharacterized protein n=1 Tax=Candidatus Nitrosocosmicus arcticus TaxID=2035267 RepID=A0A557STZ2_9ARCH|nr:hypothetical protein NARC_100145 [Candidatus Nitrosocosmicus arcticus]
MNSRISNKISLSLQPVIRRLFVYHKAIKEKLMNYFHLVFLLFNILRINTSFGKMNNILDIDSVKLRSPISKKLFQ